MKPVTPAHKTFLRYNIYFMMAVGAIAFSFAIGDFVHSWQTTVSRFGVLYYVERPIFAHKISELYIGICWFFVSLMNQFEKMGEFPTWMSQKAYEKTLYFTSVGMIVATIIATYAWTQINFGTHASTTNYAPLIFRGEALDAFAWKYYLALLVLAGAFYIVFMYKKALQMSVKEGK